MENYLRFVLALLFVLALIGVLAALVRRYGIGLGQVNIRRGGERRLSLVEVLPIDAKRRAVLLRRDDVEHLIVLGAESEMVVETQIAPPAKFADVLETAQATDPAKDASS